MEKIMKKEMGLWIDHRKAVIVAIVNNVETTQEIISNMEKHIRFSNSTDSNDAIESRGSTAEDVRDRQFGDHLDDFYDKVIPFIRDADSILIFGPGEAKVELENRLKHIEPGAHILGIETADKMTNPQITSKVRTYYSK
jgi:hypothetical protein